MDFENKINSITQKYSSDRDAEILRRGLYTALTGIFAGAVVFVTAAILLFVRHP